MGVILLQASVRQCQNHITFFGNFGNEHILFNLSFANGNHCPKLCFWQPVISFFWVAFWCSLYEVLQAKNIIDGVSLGQQCALLLVMIGQKLSLDQKSDSWLYLKIDVDWHFWDWHCLLTTLDCGKKIILWVSLCQSWTQGFKQLLLTLKGKWDTLLQIQSHHCDKGIRWVESPCL